MLLSLLAVAFLLAANAFFVSAEFALVKARGVRLEGLAEDGSRPARLALHLTGHIEAYLAACQLGITMASLGLGWVGEPVVAALLEPLFLVAGLGTAALHGVSFAVGFLLFSSLHIVLGEQVPKTFAIRRPEPSALAVAWPLHAFYLVCWPLNWALNAAAGGILRLVEVGEVMTHRRNIVSLNVDAPVAELVQRVLEKPFTRYPLWSGDPDTIIGVLHAKDLLAAVHKAGQRLTPADIRQLASPPWFVPDTTSLLHQLLAFRQRRAHLAFVVDEYGALQGLVTLEDILEEIVGDILDEKDVELSGVRTEQLPQALLVA